MRFVIFLLGGAALGAVAVAVPVAPAAPVTNSSGFAGSGSSPLDLPSPNVDLAPVADAAVEPDVVMVAAPGTLIDPVVCPPSPPPQLYSSQFLIPS